MRPKSFPELRSTLKAFSHLGPNWDSYGSDPLDPHVIELAGRALDQAEKLGFVPAAICPTAQSGITIHFQKGEIEADFDVRPDCRMETWVYKPGKIEDAPARNVPASDSDIAAALQALRKFLES